MVFNLITCFPHFYKGFLETSLIGKAISNNKITFNIVDLKDFGIGKYKKVDDTPYGGGLGMVIRVDVVNNALNSLNEKGHIILLSPDGTTFNQQKAQEYKHHSAITLISGRYEGFDRRIYSLVNEVVSIGNFITMGGEAPSLCIIEAVARLNNGIIGDINSTVEESFSAKYLKEPPQYTKPFEYKGQQVPNVLTEGNHKLIEQWRNKHGIMQ